jgi:hypothetical protein
MFRLMSRALRVSPVRPSLLSQHSLFNADFILARKTHVEIDIEAAVVRLDFKAIDTRIEHHLPWQEELFPTRTYISVPIDCVEEVTCSLRKHHAITKINGELTKRGIEFYSESATPVHRGP